MLISSCPLIWRNWDEDEHVLYHCGTGDTHVLNDLAAELLALLETESLTARELADQSAAMFCIEPDEIFHQNVAAALAEFDELGLIEPQP